MAIIRKPDLSLTGIHVSEGIPLYDELLALPGNHLRWSFNPEMGFPPGGFTLERAIWNPQFFSIGDNQSNLVLSALSSVEWITLSRLGLPNSQTEAFERIAVAPNEGILANRFEVASQDLFNTCATLRDTSDSLHQYLKYFDPGEGPGLKTGFRILDTVLLASLDPYLARMMGLYFIDKDIDSSRIYVYRVTGHWGAFQYPVIQIGFEGLSIPHRNQTLQFGAIKITSSGRTIGVSDDKVEAWDISYLFIEGEEIRPIKMDFDWPVEAVIIEFILWEGSTRIDSPTWEVKLDGVLTSISSGASQLSINRPGDGFERLEFNAIEGNKWYISKISYQKKVTAIGDLSNSHILNPSDVRGVNTPNVTILKPEQQPPLLNNKGEIDNEVSQVSISTGVLQPAVNEVDLDVATITNASILNAFTVTNRPVRILYGRERLLPTARPRQIVNLENEILSPSIYRDNLAGVTLPALLGYWPLNGHFDNVKDGVAPSKDEDPPTIFGKPRFIYEHADSDSKYSLRLNGTEALILKNQDHLKILGEAFTLEANIYIDPANATRSTLIGNNVREGYWLGLIKHPDNTFRLRLCINGTAHDATTPLLANDWIRVIASYNGQKVRFQYSGLTFMKFEEDIDATLGPVHIPAGDITIGADSGSTQSRLIHPFIGGISDVCIWQRVIHPSESRAQLAKAAVYLSQQQSTAELIFNDTTTYVVNTRREPITIEQTPQLKALGNSFSILLFVRPSIENIQCPTLLGNNFRERFWLGLAKNGANFTIRVYINGRVFNSSNTIPSEEWSHIGISYDGSNIQIYSNGRVNSNFPATLGSLVNNVLPLGIGLDTGTSIVPEQYRFNGIIQGIQFWRKAITISEWQEKVSAVQLIDRNLPNGTFSYVAKGIDLFGRTSDWSNATNVVTLAEPKYQAPVNVHAAFLPLTGIIESVSEEVGPETPEHPPEAFYRLALDVPFDAEIRSHIISYDAVVSRPVTRTNPATGRQEHILVEQLFEIDSSFNSDSGNTGIRVKKVPFSQLIPSEGDKVIIKFDYNIRLDWAWTGIQQLHFPEIESFNLYELEGHLNEFSAPISEVRYTEREHRTVKIRGNLATRNNELAGGKCLIGPNMFTITSHTTGENPEFTLHYQGMPVVIPKIGELLKININEKHSPYVDYKNKEELTRWTDRGATMSTGGPQLLTTNTPQLLRAVNFPGITENDLNSLTPANESIAERQALLRVGVDWIPLSRIYKITIPQFPRPADYAAPVAKTYVPGALVFFDLHPERSRWRSFYVLWHVWETAQRLVVYVTPGEKDEALPIVDIFDDHPLKLYLGKRYSYQGALNNIPDFTPPKATKQYHLALTARDSKDRHSLLSQWGTIVAVNRKRPPQGPKPTAVIHKKADYYDQCKVEVSWPATEGDYIKYKLYRANDSAIYTRDLEQRRTRQGFYKEFDPAEVVRDDPDFGDWLETLNPPLFLNDLFPEKDTAAWNNVTHVWRKWADRFYPALDNEELNAIGIRAGNEKAFVLITGKPITETNYVDTINGVVWNRYYYRLRLQNAALAESSIWGPLSDAEVPPMAMAPRTPVFTKVEAGDRQITLHWSLNREPDFKEYHLYRAETKRELEDLRWWTTDTDPRIIANIPDPRITTEDRAITLPGDLPIAEAGILGVYIVEDFDSDADPLTDQPHALNYFNAAPSDGDQTQSTFTISPNGTEPHRIEGLRRVPDGKAVAIVCSNTAEEVGVTFQRNNEVPYVDEGLVGLRDYYYRLVGLNEENIKSEGSKTIRTQATDKLPPMAPEWAEVTRTHIEDNLSNVNLNWIVNDPDVRCIVQRRSENQATWKKASEWLESPVILSASDNQWVFNYIDLDTTSNQGYFYRIKIQSGTGNVNNAFNTVFVDPIS